MRATVQRPHEGSLTARQVMASFTGNDFYHFHLCPHTLTNKLRPGVSAPVVQASEAQKRLWAWGIEHERAYAEREGYRELPSGYEGGQSMAVTATRDAMAGGEPRLFQAVLAAEGYYGVADLLRRLEGESSLGAFHYEVGDVKSSARPKAEQVMQVLFYSYLLERLQGRRPDCGFLILADGGEWRFSLDDYWDYFLAVLDHAMRVYNGEAVTEPLWIPACGSCKWNPLCLGDLQARDDLSLLPGMTGTARAALMRQELSTIASLAASKAEASAGIRYATFDRLRAQARAWTTGMAVALTEARSAKRGPVVSIVVETDFSRHQAAFLFAVRWRDGDASEEAIFFADTAQDMAVTATAAATWLEHRLDVPWRVYDGGTRRSLHTNLLALSGLPDITPVVADVQAAWALPVASYQLADVAAWLGLAPPPPGHGETSALRYHLYLAERDSDVREALEADVRWRLDTLEAIDQWLHAEEEPPVC